MKDSMREAWLTDHGWVFDYLPDVQLSDISIDKSAKEQIRFGDELDELVVARYSQAMRDGSQFPAIVLATYESGELVVADGLHRLAAMRRVGVKSVDAYIVTNADSPKMIELLRRTVNAPGGKGFDTTMAVSQAVALVDAGWNAEEAAKLLHVGPSAVTKRIRSRSVAPMMGRAVGLTPARILQVVPHDTLDALGRIKRQDVFDVASKIAMGGRIPGRQVAQLAIEAKRAFTDEAAKNLIDEWKETYAAALGSRVGRGNTDAAKQIRHAPQARLDRAISTLRGALTTIKNHVDGRRLDVQSRRHAADAINRITRELVKVARRIADGKSAAGD